MAGSDPELETLRQRVAHLEAQSEHAESEYTRLASLYVAAYQLHSTLEPREVMQIIIEILLNLVGARTFALLVRDDGGGQLLAVAAHGLEPGDIAPRTTVGTGTIAAAYAGQRVRPSDDLSPRAPSGEPLLAVPLRVAGQSGTEVVGVLAVWDFLEQKHSLSEMDLEIFNLLAQSAATALEAALCAREAGTRAPTPRLRAGLLLRSL
jgi:GAF domain-containing protein